jgi:membrane protein YdbS with pleckstrin-like domain
MTQMNPDPKLAAAAQADPDADVTPVPATDAPGPHATPGDHEEIYFQGSPPTRALAGALTLYGLICLVLIAIAVLLLDKHIGPWWLAAGLIVVGLAMPLIPTVKARSIRYRISNYRIDFERGILSKNIDTLELWHVEDIHFHQTLVDRILNVGNITVLSRDESLPKLMLMGIPNPRPLYEMLKQRVIAVKRQRGVMKMDPG